ncbi:hypothetical protein VKT23_011672 [Stygiomarasmius scandens]|uniref:FAD dependent oxidoreductase domain-containing protein n=1 Tax=Marasmiellus scandens TaxID=2682957 RepID=A0ABR1JCT3_9AGAR
MSESSNQLKHNVVVIGAGVIGLSTAIKIQERGRYTTTVVAELYPEDLEHPERSAKYTSCWAAAIHTGFPQEGTLQYSVNEGTFRDMWALSHPDSPVEHCFLRVPLKYHALDDLEGSKQYMMPWYSNTNVFPNPDSKGTVIQFDTLTIDSERYLPYLIDRFRKAGGRTVRGKVDHLNQLLQGNLQVDEVTGNLNDSSPSKTSFLARPDAIVVCAGLGARNLGGVEDPLVHPVRGQTVYIKAPWIKLAQMKEEEDGGETYILPRRSGIVVLGGIYTPNDWYDRPRPETKEDILHRTLKICPELVPPDALERGKSPTVDDVKKLIIGEGCGLRPGRINGIRLEVDWVDSQPGGRTPVIHNYGHTGLGYSSSWGSASKALELLEKSLAELN